MLTSPTISSPRTCAASSRSTNDCPISTSIASSARRNCTDAEEYLAAHRSRQVLPLLLFAPERRDVGKADAGMEAHHQRVRAHVGELLDDDRVVEEVGAGASV